jgi:hypothetical protein
MNSSSNLALLERFTIKAVGTRHSDKLQALLEETGCSGSGNVSKKLFQ